jgi:hypothetical protein
MQGNFIRKEKAASTVNNHHHTSIIQLSREMHAPKQNNTKYHTGGIINQRIQESEAK